jgi:hypothetical protein
MTTSESPSLDRLPDPDLDPLHHPVRGARSSFSIFIASTARSRWPAATVSPAYAHRHDASPG